MKILFVTNARLCNGAEEHLIDLGHSFVKAGIRVLFAVRESSAFAERLQQEQLPIAICFAAKGKKIRSVVTLARIISTEQPDVVSVNREHNIYLAWLAARLAAPFCKQRPKLAMVFHTPTGRRYPVLSRFDGIIATSRFTAGAFVSANPELSGKITVIHYGIHLPPPPDASKSNPERPRRFFTERGYPLIGMVGELWKNQSELIPLARTLITQFPHLTVAIVGGEDEASFSVLRELIAASGLKEHFVLVPRVSRTCIPNIFYDFDLSVSTHRNEGFGIVHIESLAAGTPAVAYRAGGLVEILEKGGSILVDGNVDDMAGAVARLLTDTSERVRLAAEGRLVVEAEFSIDIMSSRHLEFYRKLADGCPL